MIYGDEQYLRARMNDLEEIIIEPTDQFRDMLASMVRDIETLGDIVCEMQEEIKELKDAKDYNDL